MKFVVQCLEEIGWSLDYPLPRINVGSNRFAFLRVRGNKIQATYRSQIIAQAEIVPGVSPRDLAESIHAAVKASRASSRWRSYDAAQSCRTATGATV